MIEQRFSSKRKAKAARWRVRHPEQAQAVADTRLASSSAFAGLSDRAAVLLWIFRAKSSTAGFGYRVPGETIERRVIEFRLRDMRGGLAATSPYRFRKALAELVAAGFIRQVRESGAGVALFATSNRWQRAKVAGGKR